MPEYEATSCPVPAMAPRFTCYQGHSVSVQKVLQLTLDFARERGSAVREETVADDDRGGGYDGAESEAGTGEKYPRMSVGPEPRYISPEERATLEQCLVRWKAEVEEDIAGEGSKSCSLLSDEFDIQHTVMYMYMYVYATYSLCMYTITHFGTEVQYGSRET